MAWGLGKFGFNRPNQAELRVDMDIKAKELFFLAELEFLPNPESQILEVLTDCIISNGNTRLNRL